MSKDVVFGWTTCLTYETRKPLGFDHYSRLLDEMKENGMRRLIVMDSTYGGYDPSHHGIARPVLNPCLRSMVDATAINAEPSTEFLSKIIEKAHGHNIETYIEMKYRGFHGISEAYPGIEFATNRQGIPYHDTLEFGTEKARSMFSQHFICCDSSQARKFMRDMVEDLLSVYPRIHGIIMEHPDYPSSGCYCESTQEKFKSDTGISISEADESLRVAWQNERVKDTLGDLVGLAKSMKKRLRFGIYSGFAPRDGDIERYQASKGHRRETLQGARIDFVMPYMEGRHLEEEESQMERVLEYMKPLTCYIHTTVRRKPPRGYPVPSKTPSYIRRIVNWFLNYCPHDPNVEGMSFFNEVNTPPENRQAIYETIQRAHR